MARTDEAEATIRILGEDLLTSTAQKAEKSVDKIGDAAEKAKGPLGRLRERMDSLGETTFFTEMNQASELARKGLGLLTAGYEQLRQAAADRSIGVAFERAFGSGAGGLERLAQATQGLLANNALREIATQGARAGLSLEQVSRLLESSTRASLATGRDLRETSDAFLKSVIESNDEATKQLGVLVNLGGAQDAYARSIGTTADKLTTAQKAQASLAEVTRQTDLAFQEVTGDATLSRLSRLEAKWQNLTSAIRDAALGLTIGLPETIDAAVNAQQQALDSGQQRILDNLTKGDYSRANIDRIIDAMRQAGDVQEAYRLNLDLTARATALLSQEEAKLDAVFAERQRHLDALAAAESARVKALTDEVRKEDEARYAAVEHARQLALVADAVGSAEQASDRWQAALSALGAAHVSAADDVTTLYGAIRASNSEMAKAIELEAELAAAAGDVSGAAALRAQALGVATNETGGPGTTKPRGGGGRSKLDQELAANDRKMAEDLQRQWNDVAKMREDAERAAAERADQIRQEDNARAVAEAEAYAAEHERIQQQMISSREAGFGSLADSVRGLRDAFGELDGISLDGLANAAQGMGPLIQQFEALQSATDQSKGAMVSGSLGIAAASGRMVAGIIKDQRAQAVIMALVEQAEAWGAFARMDYVGFGAHLTSSAIWAAVAGSAPGGARGGGGGGGGDRGGRRETAGVPNETPPEGPSFQPIAIHISGGTYLGTDAERTGRELARMIDRHRGRSFRAGDAGGPP